ncbi:MAG: metallophosphoesterase [Dehalococcoidia bacterium]|jgi:DNA repair exonuclease SbcCD nuclease subunit
MIKTVAHLADIHIRKTPTRNEEYRFVFKNLLKSLAEKKPDRIVIAGDLVHDYLDLQGEQLILANGFLNSLATIAPVRITRGNHDCRKKNLKRVDSVKAIVETLNNPNVIYYNNTDVFYDENVAWMVWHHGDPKNNPWKTKEGKIYEKLRINNDYVAIDLFHDPVNGCKTPTGFEMKSKSLYKLSDFKGDLSFFGDIHKAQFLDDKQTKAYCGSLIAQDISEGDGEFHGYMLWNTENKTAELVPVRNYHSFKNVDISPYMDFNDLDFEIENPTEEMHVRFVWKTLPQTRTKDNERKLFHYIKSKHPNTIILHKNVFIETEKIEVNENITLQNISNKVVQHEIFKEYLEKIGTDPDVINDILALDEEILNLIDIKEDAGIEWDIIKFGGVNFASYATLDVDWRDKDGLFQITGINTAGKTTIMKLITYALFTKSLETESRMKYGDSRFVNNRNGASYCEAYLVIEANGEYFGIKKRTDISRAKDGSINGSPTTFNYYILPGPDDEMNDGNLLDKLDEDKRVATQKKLESIIGSYDNFMRIVMTTSDTLNRILSNDMAIFIDSLLYDSGLDIFDKKLEGLKIYQKSVNDKPRVTCSIEMKEVENAGYVEEIRDFDGKITNIETVVMPDIQYRILTGRTYVETLTKKLYTIDPEIYGLNVLDTKGWIDVYKRKIDEHNARERVLNENIVPLKESYDEQKLETLIKEKELHKLAEYNDRLKIKAVEQAVRDEEHAIEIINGDIFRLKQDGAKYKKDISELKNSKICPTCGQPLTAEHQSHIDAKIKEKETEMFAVAAKINEKESNDKTVHQENIRLKNDEILLIKKTIEEAALQLEDVLAEIGNLTNDKNDVEKRKEMQTELNQLPTLIQNEELKIKILQQKIDNHENSLKQIEENHRIEKGIEAAKKRLSELEARETDERENIFILKGKVGDRQKRIKDNETLVTDFKAQEYRDLVMNLYKKCVHRDGIPRQMLSNYIIPKINLTLETILSVAPFKVWLDQDDLRPKLAYNNRPSAVIDCIGASGKERTFASVVLKFALNQINVKAKPTIFLLDEVMGKLDLEGSVEEFIEILHMIKNSMKKTLVIEQVHEINPDYLINVQLDEDGISSLVIE